MPKNFDVLSFADGWQSYWGDDQVAVLPSQWRFAADVSHASVNQAIMKHGPTVKPMAETGGAVLRMQRIHEMAFRGQIAAALAVSTEEDPRLPTGVRHDIVGVGVATPGVALHERLPRHQRWYPVETSLPLVRLEVVVSDRFDDWYGLASGLTKQTSGLADELYPGTIQAAIVSGPKRRYQGYSETMAGIGNTLGCLVGEGRYAWGDHLPLVASTRRPAQVIANHPELT